MATVVEVDHCPHRGELTGSRPLLEKGAWGCGHERLGVRVVEEPVRPAALLCPRRKVTPEQRSEIARKAAEARWAKKRREEAEGE